MVSSQEGSNEHWAPKRYLILGASGYVGRMLVPRLIEAGHSVVLLGRERIRLRRQFPHLVCLDSSEWQREYSDFDAVINLAVVNNNKAVDWSQFELVNAELPAQVALKAASAGIPYFIQISSVLALDDSNFSYYSRSKRLADEKLGKVRGIEVVTLYLGAVWGDGWSGSLRVLNYLPRSLALKLFGLISALKPTVHANNVVRAIQGALFPMGAHKGRGFVVADNQDENIWYRMACLLRDYGFALSVLVFFWWGLLIIWLWVRLGSPGPGIFAQERIGHQGKPFTCYKFRTMSLGTVQAGTHEVSADAVTSVGAFLRRTKLDELPQIWNILKGELRLVGPRPSLPAQKELFARREARGVFSVKPGITGWAQTHDVDMSDPERLAWWDAQYIGMRGILLDLRIILATAFGRGRGDRVGK